MDEYLIGSGALLTGGPTASIAPATLHAQPDPALTAEVRASVVDFEATSAAEVSRLLIVAAGWDGPSFEDGVVRQLLALRECSLADVIATLAEATGADTVHLFAHWQPDAVTIAHLSARGIRIEAHPLAALGQAALVSGQRVTRWTSPVRAA